MPAEKHDVTAILAKLRADLLPEATAASVWLDLAEPTVPAHAEVNADALHDMSLALVRAFLPIAGADGMVKFGARAVAGGAILSISTWRATGPSAAGLPAVLLDGLTKGWQLGAEISLNLNPGSSAAFEALFRHRPN